MAIDNDYWQHIKNKYVTQPVHIAPLAVLRMVFGAVMFISTARFMANGWVKDFFITPTFHFPFYGFEWVRPFPPTGMYVLYGVMLLAALCVAIGLFYRVAVATFFLCFCYAELIDKTYYLNHYYLVSIITFLLMLTPAHRYFSLDVLRKPALKVTQVPAWTIYIFQLQLCIVYFFAGLSKVNYDWLIAAMPLKIWLHAKEQTPYLGILLRQSWSPWVFSWAGALFDLSIAFLLMGRRTRKVGYAMVVIFHVLTALLFQIGMFPYIMMAVTIIFFPASFHWQLIRLLSGGRGLPEQQVVLPWPPHKAKAMYGLLVLYFSWQLFMPVRFLLYPGKLLWTEEGYRFSWRVMLMEKGGTTFFYIKNPATGRQFEINNARLLTPYQERMMETQPDMMLQYAHLLHDTYAKKGIPDPQVSVASYVSLNGSGSRLYIDSTVNLATQRESWFGHKTWILPFKKNQP
ncbi:HTTM domain-containing protein [Chitinophaga costaii]|nr:HTTM domain-containing protein [Chitinophaga costaii]